MRYLDINKKSVRYNVSAREIFLKRRKFVMSLKVDIFTRNMEVTDRINDYVNKKVSKLDRFLLGIDEARVDLNYIK